MTYRILVTGSRTWTDEETVHGALTDALPDPLEPGRDYVVVHGACPRGADAMASRWCENESWWVDNVGAALIEERHPADWSGPAKGGAGFARNAEMVRLGADICLAFVDPCSKPRCRKPQPHGSHGATHCADLAEGAGIKTLRYPEERA